MARRTVFDDSSDDDFPEIHDLGRRKDRRTQLENSPTQATQRATEETSAAKSTIRRRKLAQITDNALLRPWSEQGSPAGENKPKSGFSDKKRPETRVQLRKRVPRTVTKEIQIRSQSSGEEISVNESSEDESSEFHTALDSELDEDDSFTQIYSVKPPKKTLSPKKETIGAGSSLMKPEKEPLPTQQSTRLPSGNRVPPSTTPPKRTQDERKKQKAHQREVTVASRSVKPVQRQPSHNDLTEAFSKLQTSV